MTRATNLTDPLTRYRINSQGLTAGGEADNPRGRTHAIREAEWARLGLTYELYDDHPAAEISAFLRGEGIPQVGARMAAYVVLLDALEAVLAASRRRSRLGERAERRSLAEALMTAMVAQPPARPERRRRLHERCVAVDRAAARAAGTESVAADQPWVTWKFQDPTFFALDVPGHLVGAGVRGRDRHDSLLALGGVLGARAQPLLLAGELHAHLVGGVVLAC